MCLDIGLLFTCTAVAEKISFTDLHNMGYPSRFCFCLSTTAVNLSAFRLIPY
uniref:Uncharacterized protein n=1 Tax=Anguilla anguilla TaxID=7936 RepID=A0A0E9U7J2_ANGAN